jgi:hypothetical protein
LLTGFKSTLTFLQSQTITGGLLSNLICTNLNTGSLSVDAGDRFAVRVMVSRPNLPLDIAGVAALALLVADVALITRAGFSASMSYTPTP